MFFKEAHFVLFYFRIVENGKETVEEYENDVLIKRLVDGNVQAIKN